MMDVLDIKIMKYLCTDLKDIYYIADVSKVMRISRSMARLRLKKLCRFGFAKEVSVYPCYFVPNAKIKAKIDEISMPEGLGVPREENALKTKIMGL